MNTYTESLANDLELIAGDISIGKLPDWKDAEIILEAAVWIRTETHDNEFTEEDEQSVKRLKQWIVNGIPMYEDLWNSPIEIRNPFGTKIEFGEQESVNE